MTAASATVLLQAIPYAATSPFALFAYVVAALVFVLGGIRLSQLKQVRHILKESGESANLSLIIAQVTGRPLPKNLTGKQWLAHQQQQGTLLVSFAAMVLVATIAIVAIVERREPVPGELTVRVRVRTTDGDIVTSGTVSLGLLQPRTEEVLSNGCRWAAESARIR